MKYWKYILILVIFIPILLFRDFTPSNELRYLVIADEALRDGHFFAFYNQGVAYADKPPLYLWIVMASRVVFGTHSMLWLGMFSILPAFVILWVMNRWAAVSMTQTQRVTAQLMLVTTGYFLGAMAVLRMDMLMAMFIVLALYTFYRIYLGDTRKSLLWLLPIYVFGALFTKGPFGVMTPVAGIIAFLAIRGSIRRVGQYLGWRFWTVLVSLCVLWFLCVFVEGGTSYLSDLLFNQTVNRAVNSFSHSKGFFYYFITFPYAFAPWSLLIIIVFAIVVFTRGSLDSLQQFFLTIIVTTWLMLSCISSKLEIYLLPIYPFVAFFVVSTLGGVKYAGWLKVGVSLPIIIYLLALPAAIILPMFINLPLWVSTWPVYAACGAMLVMGCGAAIELFSMENIFNSIQVLAWGLLMAAASASFVVPQLNGDIGYGNLAKKGAQIAARHHGCGYMAYDVSRASGMELYLQSDVNEVSLSQLHHAWREGIPSVVFLRNSDIDRNDTLRMIAGNRECERVGRYCVLMINGNNGNK